MVLVLCRVNKLCVYNHCHYNAEKSTSVMVQTGDELLVML